MPHIAGGIPELDCLESGVSCQGWHSFHPPSLGPASLHQSSMGGRAQPSVWSWFLPETEATQGL